MAQPREMLRMTVQRRVILETLVASKLHPTADELYELVRRRLPRISLGTVYRNLEDLHQAGLIRKLEFAGCRKRFDKTVNEHYHIRCERCGRIEDIARTASEGLMKKLSPKTDFLITGHRLEFTGICPTCRKKRKR